MGIYDCGKKRMPCEEFSAAAHMVCDEKQQVTSECLEAARIATNKYMITNAGRAKFKFAGRQKVHVSSKWGFTKFQKDDYNKWKAQGRLINNGVDVKWLSSRGPLHRLIGRDVEE